ncbi:DNA polymerase zeta catalytic subunit [Colias croceus]|uniref:DNA polymerase zeta catalytic subunit n=1 Tax=Colias crocea TaxID=72248 RepID=UPI001E27B4CF|nr:DNA polymerase zeta catalytic subunit [Colias croceus]XP_045493796.1 DNA polymerase zeta catalytic subunit [Colias croceus]
MENSLQDTYMKITNSNNHTGILDIKPEFSVRIVVCDSYLTKPLPGIDVIYSEFRGSDIKQVPILRIFGSTPDGRKACLHVHGVFPYFYIPCPTSHPEPQFLYQVAVSLDKALNIALKQANSSNQHVYKISLVKGLPFYGFHDKEHLFLKVFLYNPGLIKQAVELCSNGAILGQVLQPHESHLNFTLQFFIDFNLFGMSNIDLQTVMFRKSLLTQQSDEPSNSPEDFSLKRESMCYYEADCVASHIINRLRIGKGDGIENPGLEEVWKQEMARRRELNVSIASKSLSQNRLMSEGTETHHKFKTGFIAKISNLIDKPVEVVTENKEFVHYPAESLEGSQFFNATDISTHLHDSILNNSSTINRSLRRNSIIISGHEDTIVDEDIALNSSVSVHYSQVNLDNDDLELLDMLQGLDDKPIDDDSVMGTPCDQNPEDDINDEDYSQVFNDETIFIGDKCEETMEEDSPSWHDSFWEGVNIPQLDGTCDDDHVKKVRKRKKLPLKLGLSRPKIKNKSKNTDISQKSKEELDESDEINVSRETIDNISDLHLKRVKPEQTEPDNFISTNNQESQSILDKESIFDLVNKIETSTVYDLKNNCEPIAGPSKIPMDSEVEERMLSLSDSVDSSPDSKIGIESFYDQSKFFDVSVENVINVDHDISTNFDILPKTDHTDNLNQTPYSHVINKSNELTVYKTNNRNDLILTPKIRPPARDHIMLTLKKYSIPKQRNPEPYFSNPKDVGDKVEIGQIILKTGSKLSQDQKPFERVIDTTTIEEWRQLLFLQRNEMSDSNSKPETLKSLLAGNRQCILKPLKLPPTKKEILKWSHERSMQSQVPVEKDVDVTEISKNLDEMDTSQAIGLNDDDINNSISLEDKSKQEVDNTLQVTMHGDGSFLCFGNSEVQNEASISTPAVEVDFLTLMILEVHTKVRGDMCPDPALDDIKAVFVSITNNCPDNHFLAKQLTQILVVDESKPPKHLDRCVFNANVVYVDTESEIFDKIINLVKEHDPDIMCGYEIEMNSWGYVLERAQFLGLEIVKEISRITEKYRQKKWRHDENEMEGRIIGRITFNVWRLFRYELALSSYSFENCMYQILKERVPKYSHSQLSEWWNDESRMLRWIPVEYYLTRLSGTVRMLEKLDMINRTSELARLFGLQWWEVLSRGSQFRVESLMLRAARPLNLVALSPTVKQRAAMRAPECLPLIFEPESRFYNDPVIVLDFQSLYPSMMIAYNYCFSTCIGRIQNINGNSPYEFGAWRLRIPKEKLEALAKNNLVHWSPVGVGFVKANVRRGVLPVLLRRILAARQAVKKGMKMQTDEAVKKAMHSRQLGLKLIANVTYGYTAANFSGRMPCVEVGDSVVSKGRETLERAIKLVREGKWNAKVIYGDTDSMFVLVPGGSRTEAFEIGQEIADAVTADNPSPVVLKLEKVYQPCILQTKKRYVGYMYESADQEKPVYEAKGIETVRRDGCPASVKLLQSSLCELFDTGDISRVKKMVKKLLSRLIDGSLPPQELFFTREYHGAAGYRPTAAAPPNEIAKRLLSRDPRAAPRTSERVSWLVTAGAPGTPLVRLARTPAELHRDPGLVPHVPYYATRAILPPLHRCFSLLGVDVFKWWNEVGHTREALTTRGTVGTASTRAVGTAGSRAVGIAGAVGKTGVGGVGTAGAGIARYMQRGRCAACGARGARAICARCALNPRPVVAMLAARDNTARGYLADTQVICSSCCGHSNYLECNNTECPVLWCRVSAQQKLNQLQDVFANLPEQFNTNSLNF